jgi:hypothetical protein
VDALGFEAAKMAEMPDFVAVQCRVSLTRGCHYLMRSGRQFHRSGMIRHAAQNLFRSGADVKSLQKKPL